jgi:hypothetical protein
MLEGRTCPEKVALVGRVLREPDLARPDEDWGRLAATLTSKQLRTEVRRRETERRHGMAVPLSVFLSPRGAEDFLRCREITIQKAQKPLTEGETLERVFDDYLERNDPERKAVRARSRGAVADATRPRAKHAPGADRGRHLPAAERHALILKRGDRCAFEGCENSILENAHRIPFRSGGSNAAKYQDRCCRIHHELLDRGELKIVGAPGKEVVVDRAGTVVNRLRGPPFAA